MGVAGCLGGGDGDGGGAIQLSMDGEWAEAQEPIVEALYEAGLSEDIDVEFLPGDFETDSRQADFTSALDSRRSSPDIFMMDYGWTMPFIVREQLVNLSEELSELTQFGRRDCYLAQNARNGGKSPQSGQPRAPGSHGGVEAK
jgi:ABC-type glycerol-3-phosphate transport system substrate-binding protein